MIKQYCKVFSAEGKIVRADFELIAMKKAKLPFTSMSDLSNGIDCTDSQK
jgi:hypothetical protein